MVEAMGDRGSSLIERMAITADGVNSALAASSDLVTDALSSGPQRSPSG